MFLYRNHFPLVFLEHVAKIRRKIKIPTNNDEKLLYLDVVKIERSFGIPIYGDVLPLVTSSIEPTLVISDQSDYV